MQLKGTKTEESLKAAFAGESKANRRYLYFANMADIEGAPEVATYSVTLPKVRLAMHTATWNTSFRVVQVILKLVWLLETLLKHLSLLLQVKLMSTQTCIQAWQKLHVKKASTKSLIGSKLLQKQSVATQTNSRKLWTRTKQKLNSHENQGSVPGFHPPWRKEWRRKRNAKAI